MKQNTFLQEKMWQSFSVDFPNLLVHRSVREVRQRLCGGIWKPGNDELILLHRSRYNSYKPTFFQNQSYAQRCWTSKEGPNAFEECESVREIIHFYFPLSKLFSLPIGRLPPLVPSHHPRLLPPDEGPQHLPQPQARLHQGGEQDHTLPEAGGGEEVRMVQDKRTSGESEGGGKEIIVAFFQPWFFLHSFPVRA